MILLVLGFYVCIIVVMLLILLFVTANIGAVFQAFHTKQTTPAIHQDLVPSGENTGLSGPSDTSGIEDQLRYWQAQLQKQPTSRDILLNLSVLYEQDNQPDVAQEYRAKAEEIDPNYTQEK